MSAGRGGQPRRRQSASTRRSRASRSCRRAPRRASAARSRTGRARCPRRTDPSTAPPRRNCIHSLSVANEKVYIHEFIDIIGHNRAAYMHHMTANWSPEAQEQRQQLCYGVWAVLGSTGRWPAVVNIWEHDGWDGLAQSFGVEAVGKGAQDPTLEAWWAKAAEFRSGGQDRILEPAPWTRTITELCGDGVQGQCYAHEMIVVRNGGADEFLDRVRVC